MSPLTCHRCGTIDEPKVFEAGPHLKAVCAHCGRYIKFLSKEEHAGKYRLELQFLASLPKGRAWLEWLVTQEQVLATWPTLAARVQEYLSSTAGRHA